MRISPPERQDYNAIRGRKRLMAATVTQFGGIVLCGGRSTRMGTPKLWLPFGDVTMLEHVVDVMRQVLSPIVVVAAPGQPLPTLPDDVLVARDEYDALGPLAGLAVGLAALRPQVDAAYATSCDVPLLKPAFIEAVTGALGEHDLAIPREERFHHPLAAVYRTALEPKVRELIAAGRMRPFFLVEECDAREIDVEELRTADPDLDSLRNANTPEEYQAVLALAGLSVGKL